MRALPVLFLLLLILMVAACASLAPSSELVPLYGLTPIPRDVANPIDSQGGCSAGSGDPTPTPFAWVPAYRVTPTPPLFPTPTPTPARPATTVKAQWKEIALGQIVSIAVVAQGIADPAGLGEYDVEISFDPQGLRVDSVAAAPAFADLQPGNTLFYDLDEPQGKLLLVAYRSASPGPTGDVELAHLSLTGLKPGVWPVDVTIHTLKSSEGRTIPAAGVPGAVSVRRLIAS